MWHFKVVALLYRGGAAQDQDIAWGIPIYSTGKHICRESKLFSHCHWRIGVPQFFVVDWNVFLLLS